MADKEIHQMQVVNGAGEVQKILLPESDANAISYIDTEPVINAIGGVAAGSTYPDGTVQQVLYDILHPYVKPTISLSADPNGGVREKGTTLSDITFTATIGKKSANITKVEFFVGGSSAGVISSPSATGGQETLDYGSNITTNTSVYANVTDAKEGTTKSNTISYTFVYPAYVGYVDASASSPTQDQIKAMEKKVQNKATISYTYTVDTKRLCIATPPGWTLTKITDPSGFDVTSTYAKSTLSITGLDGTAQTYNIYLSQPTTQTGYKVTFA